jgi:hypothetical protein
MNITDQDDNELRRLLRDPGFLLAPLGWLTQWLIETAESESALLATIYSLSPQRMHLIALALAHRDDPRPTDPYRGKPTRGTERYSVEESWNVTTTTGKPRRRSVSFLGTAEASRSVCSFVKNRQK